MIKGLDKRQNQANKQPSKHEFSKIPIQLTIYLTLNFFLKLKNFKNCLMTFEASSCKLGITIKKLFI